MGDSKMASPVADAVDDHGSSIIRVQNADELRLAQMGMLLNEIINGLLLTMPRP
jgi:choline transport protein